MPPEETHDQMQLCAGADQDAPSENCREWLRIHRLGQNNSKAIVFTVVLFTSKVYGCYIIMY